MKEGYRINNVSAKTFIIWNRSLGAFARERCQLVAQVLEANKGNFLYLTDAHDSNMNKVICADKEERDGQSKKCDEQRTVIRAEYNSPGLLEKIKDSVVKGGSPAQSNSIYKEYLDTSWIDWRSFIRNIDEENDE